MAKYRVGRNFFSTKSNEQLVAKLSQSLLQQIIESGLDQRRADGPKVAAAMEKAALGELNKLGPFIAQNLIGTVGSVGRTVEVDTGIFDKGVGVNKYDANSLFANDVGGLLKLGKPSAGQRLQWRSLSLKTERQKGHNRFFERTGELRNYFNQSSELITAGLGKTSVTFKNKKGRKASGITSRREIYGSLVISTASRVSPAGLPALKTGNITDVNPRQPIERRIFDEATSMKLFGPQGKPELQRPLFQPALAYWLLYRVPIAISRAMGKSFERYAR